MNKKFRLKKSTDFKRVRRIGKSYADPLIVLISENNKSGNIRFGIVAGRTFKNAVQRNRAKRLMRAALVPLIDDIPYGCDIILIARRPLTNASLHDIQDAIIKLLERANLTQTSRNQKDFSSANYCTKNKESTG